MSITLLPEYFALGASQKVIVSKSINCFTTLKSVMLDLNESSEATRSSNSNSCGKTIGEGFVCLLVFEE